MSDLSKWEVCGSPPEGREFISKALSPVISSVFWNDAKHLAMAMGTHSRLGAFSWLKELPPESEILKMIASKADLLGSLDLVAIGNRGAIVRRWKDSGTSKEQIETLMEQYLEEKKRIQHDHYIEVLAGGDRFFFRPVVSRRIDEFAKEKVSSDMAAHLQNWRQNEKMKNVRWAEGRR